MTSIRRRDGQLDRRFNRPSGMVADGTRVDFYSPKPVCGVCGHFSHIHRTPPPHRYQNAMHCAIRVAA